LPGANPVFSPSLLYKIRSRHNYFTKMLAANLLFDDNDYHCYIDCYF
jgi:hypothetical protein